MKHIFHPKFTLFQRTRWNTMHISIQLLWNCVLFLYQGDNNWRKNKIKASLSQEEDDFIDPWCASRVDSSGGYVGEWVECNSECPVCKTVDSKNF